MPTPDTLPFRPLLITGEMRSGTTLAANFLDAQADCSVYPDLLKAWFSQIPALGITDVSKPLSEKQKNVLVSSLVPIGWTHSLDFEQIERASFSSWIELYNRVLTILNPESDRVVGTKATRESDLAERLLPYGHRVVYCVRDPRDVMLSSSNRFAGFDAHRFAHRWRESFNRAMDLADHDGFYVLRFEKLIDPETREAEAAALGRFLGIELRLDIESVEMRSGARFVSNSSFGDVKGMFDPRASGRWRDAPEASEVVLAEAVLSDEIARLGYPAGRSPERARRDAARRYGRWRVRQRVRGAVRSLVR